MIPPIEPVRLVARALSDAGITAALGGSGLLHALGLTDTVNDWDLTTDAPLEQVQAALAAIPHEAVPHGDKSFATGYRLHVHAGQPEIDLMGWFAIATETGVVHLPTVVAGVWEGVPAGSPEVWAVAYRLMGRHPKAALLNNYLREHGYCSEIRAYLLAQPLPDPVRTEVNGW